MAAQLSEWGGVRAWVRSVRLTLLTCAACGAETLPAPSSGPEPVSIPIQAPSGVEAESASLDGDFLGFDQGRPIYSNEDGLFRGGEDGGTELDFVALQAEDLPPDEPSAVVTSADGGWLAASNGIYALEDRFVLPVDAAARPAWLTASLDELPGLWWAEGQRLIRWTDASSEELDLSAFGPASELVFAGSHGLVRIGNRLFELSEGSEYTLRDVTPQAPGLGPMTGHDGAWWVGQDAALLRKPAGRDEAWTPLLFEGRRIRGLVSGADGALWVQTDIDLLRMEAPYEAAVVRSESAVEELLPSSDGTVARLGQGILQVWVDTTAEVVGFEADVLPWLNEHGCITCHSSSPGDYSDYEVFSGLAAEALSRVRTGDMPRCGAGLCPPESQLGPEEYELLETWIAAGRPR